MKYDNFMRWGEVRVCAIYWQGWGEGWKGKLSLNSYRNVCEEGETLYGRLKKSWCYLSAVESWTDLLYVCYRTLPCQYDPQVVMAAIHQCQRELTTSLFLIYPAMIPSITRAWSSPSVDWTGPNGTMLGTSSSGFGVELSVFFYFKKRDEMALRGVESGTSPLSRWMQG